MAVILSAVESVFMVTFAQQQSLGSLGARLLGKIFKVFLATHS